MKSGNWEDSREDGRERSWGGGTEWNGNRDDGRESEIGGRGKSEYRDYDRGRGRRVVFRWWREKGLWAMERGGTYLRGEQGGERGCRDEGENGESGFSGMGGWRDSGTRKVGR